VEVRIAALNDVDSVEADRCFSGVRQNRLDPSAGDVRRRPVRSRP